MRRAMDAAGTCAAAPDAARVPTRARPAHRRSRRRNTGSPPGSSNTQPPLEARSGSSTAREKLQADPGKCGGRGLEQVETYGCQIPPLRRAVHYAAPADLMYSPRPHTTSASSTRWHLQRRERKGWGG